MSDQSVKPTPKAQAEKLLKALLKGKEVYKLFSEFMRKQLTISGQPIDHWEEKFKLSIPVDDLTPAICKQLDVQLMGLSQEATFHHAVASAKVQMIKRGCESQFNDKFWALTQEYKEKGRKLPAAATLQTLATIQNDDMESAQSLASVETKFWKDILDHLATCRRLIENASLNISVELKALNAQNMIDNINKNGGI
jgi:hypothetical protein